MFRNMRRANQLLSQEECSIVLQSNTSGVLALNGDDGYPYAVPLSYAYADGVLYFHGALTGHKVDAIRRNKKCSFCVIDKDDVVAQKLTTAYRSVIIFGTAHILEQDEDIRHAAQLLGQKYSPGLDAMVEKETQTYLHHMAVIRLDIEHMTGKVGKELLPESQQ